ncbi:hypothetical protein PVAP13_1NG266800 [Panicum virgatum]|uniref:GRF-type domain-containing protein n=1 Tax=Panicum virgatum TaxID=38727 RepID=A0A8T0WU68_PANVG|nr:hypothetical protein PVAP13_1NG266800 [Panicum virgatum]
MDWSSSSAGGRDKNEMPDLPLIECPECRSRMMKGMMARTKKNFGRFFLVCPSRQKNGSGCQFWCWDDEYEKYLMSNGHVFASYQPIFSRNLELVQKEGTEVARTPKLMQLSMIRIRLFRRSSF